MQQIFIGIILLLGFATYYFYSQNQILTANNAALESAVATQEESIATIQVCVVSVLGSHPLLDFLCPSNL